MKSADLIKELRSKSSEELQTFVGSAEQELMNLRFRLSAGQLKQTAQINLVKRKIARAKTILSEKTLEQ